MATSAIKPPLLDKKQMLTTSVSDRSQAILGRLRPAVGTFAYCVPEPSAGTCEWIYSHADLHRYFQSVQPVYIKIHGSLGCGKSVLARSLASKLKERFTVLSFHFRPPAPGHAAEAMLGFACSMLYQIVMNYMNQGLDTGCELNQLYDLLVASSHPSEYEIEDLLNSLRNFLSAHRAPFVLLVDGPCEYRELDGNSIDWIGKLADFISSINALRKGCIFVFCRSSCLLSTYLEPDISLRMDQNLTRADILRFKDDEVQRLCLPSRIHPAIDSWVDRNASGNFLLLRWYLRSLHAARTEDELQQRSIAFPTEMFQAFDDIIKTTYGVLRDHQKAVCRNILKTVLAADKALLVEEVASLEGLIVEKADEHIPELCNPLLEIRENRVEFCHSFARMYLISKPQYGNNGLDTLHLSINEAAIHLAKRQLKLLISQKYSSLDAIGQLIWHNVGPGADIEPIQILQNCSCEDPAYSHAARSWFITVTQVQDPDECLLDLIKEFLEVAQFVYWAEYTKQYLLIEGTYPDTHSSNVENGFLIQAYKLLRAWVIKSGISIDLSEYCTRPYNTVSQEFASVSTDKVLQWLTLRQLSNFLFAIADTKLTFDLRQKIREGLTNLLGAKHPLTLRACLDAAFVSFVVNEMDVALSLYTDLFETQRNVLGERAFETLESQMHIGQAQYYLNRFQESDHSLVLAVDKLGSLLGDKHVEALAAQWARALELDAARQEDLAFKIFQYIYLQRVESYGHNDLFAVMVEGSIGDIHRRWGEQKLATERLEHARNVRRDVWQADHYLVVDATLNLVVLYWEFGMLEEGRLLVNEVELGDTIVSKFQRYCQLCHLKALLSIEGAQVDESINILRTLAQHAQRSQYNRALFWALLDLATLLRSVRKNDEASSLFHNIVKNTGTDSRIAQSRALGDREPEPSDHLAAAEAALKLVRIGEKDAADDYLLRKNLTWLRPKDLWLWVGGPVPNTETMRGPFRAVLADFKLIEKEPT